MTDTSANTVKSTIVDGLIILLPLGLILIIAMKLVAMLRELAEPFAELLPESLRYPSLIAVTMLLFLSLIAGLLARTGMGKKAGVYFEGSVLNRIPGYALLRSLIQSVRTEETLDYAPVFVETDESLALGFIIEIHDDGRYTVFIPSAPTPTAGAVFVMEPNRVHFIDAHFMDVVKTVSKFGMGSASLMKSIRPSGSAEPAPKII